jgi:hypothetical protein
MLLVLALAGFTLAAAGPVRHIRTHAFDDRLTPPPEPPIFLDSPAGYTQAALNAWVSGDGAQLRYFLRDSYEADHWLPPGYDTHFRLKDCGAGRQVGGCEYVNRDGDTVYFLLMSERLGHPQAIRILTFLPVVQHVLAYYPMERYGDECLYRWSRGDIEDVEVAAATTPEAKKQLDALASHRKDLWTYVGVREAGGASYQTWRNDNDDRLVFRYNSSPSVRSPGPHWIVAVLWNPQA